MKLSRKGLTFAVKAMTDDGAFELYAATFDVVDRQGELIVPGAFQNLPQFVADGWGDVNHHWDGLGIATIDSASQDAVGLKITGRFHSTADAQAVRTKIRERMERGKTCACSIGYREIEATDEMRDGAKVRVLKALALYEFSFVAVPANPLAQVTAVKSFVESVKSGRTLSKSNHAKLAAWADATAERGKAACEHAAEMKAWLDDHAPKGLDDAPEELDARADADDVESKKAALTRRALKARAQTPRCGRAAVLV